MSSAKREKLKLMVVDDEPDNLDLLYRTFRREFKVFRADGAINALEMLEKEGEMAIIISDQRMPIMNGTEFLSKTVEEYPETIRILLTGYTDVDDLVDAINSGKVFKYITKPWTPDHLKSVVTQAAETYKVVKQRTNELRRTLRQKTLFNLITSAIRESLDYENMLQTIVTNIGQNFAIEWGIIQSVEKNKLGNISFFYPDQIIAEASPHLDNLKDLMKKVLETNKIEIVQEDNDGEIYTHLALPLIFQKQTLVVLGLHQIGDANLWTELETQLLEEVGEQAALAISQAKLYQQIQQQADKMRSELEVARQIQRNLLRNTWPEFEDVKIQATCTPARQVGGDFFEVSVHSQGDIWFALGDVSGKGVPAALFMASALSVLRRELAQEISPDPFAVMKNLNAALLEDLASTNCFITMVLARYRPETRELVYVNAGHIYPMLWPHSTLINTQDKTEIQPNYLKERGIPIGILPVWRGKIGTITLNPGDVFLLVSDGITEATVKPDLVPDSPNSMLNQDGLWKIICQESSSFELESLLSNFYKNTQDAQEDDQTIVILEALEK
jgi:serine phosphatase RsbU (regulator of sigma subunit)/FixJ family two-component response regulator